MDDPRQELVRRLLEYKKYRDAASILEERSRAWQQHYPRLSNDLPRQGRDLADEPIQEVELWDLVSAFRPDHARDRGRQAVEHRLRRHADPRLHGPHPRPAAGSGRLAFRDLFEPGMHKSTLVGIFLAILELVRHHHVRVEQNALFGEIWLAIEENCTEPLDLSDVDNYEHTRGKRGLGTRIRDLGIGD